MGHVFSNRKSKLIALFGVIVLAVLLSKCVGGDADSMSSGSVSSRWVKTNFEDHTMYIRTDDDISGVYTDVNGKQREALFMLGCTNDAFFATAKIGKKLWNPADAPVRVDGTLTIPESDAVDFRQETVTGTVAAGDDGNAVIWFSVDDKSHIHNALLYYPGVRLDFTVTESGSSELFGFELPSEDEYSEIVDRTAKAMTIPSYSDKIHDDEDKVNPALKAFFEEFRLEFNDQVRRWAENDGVTGSVLQLLEVMSDTGDNPEMTRLWRQYKYIDVSMLRERDAEFYRWYAEQINQIVNARSLASSWTVIESGMAALDKMAEIALEW